MVAVRRILIAGLLLLGAGDTPLDAQPFEQAGVRALGLGGTFVAVADDASAVWWNPAGLASGPFFNVILERQVRRREPADRVFDLERPAIDQTLTGFALATPPLGLSYYRTRYSMVPVEPANGNPENTVGAFSLVAHQTGVTILQSIAPGLAIGSTIKFVRGIVAADLEREEDTEAALDRAADAIGRATNRLDADIGVHWVSGPFRAGLTVRNVFEPTFDAGEERELALERQARAGVAFLAGDMTIVAADIDVTEQEEDPAGRRLALGIEHRLNPRVAVRGGFRTTTGDETDRAWSAGGSLAVRPGLWLDGFWSQADFAESHWGLAVRFSY